MEPVTVPGVLRIEPALFQPGYLAVTFLDGVRFTVHVPQPKVQDVLAWWLTIAPEVAVDGYIPEEAVEQFRADLIAAAVPDDPASAF